MAIAERHIKRLVIALIVAIIMICISNLAWLYLWNSYEYVGDSQAVTVDSDGGNANYIGSVRHIKRIIYKSEELLFKHF